MVAGRWGADVVEAVAAAGAGAHRLRTALAQATQAARPRGLVRAWARALVELRVSRDLAARAVLDAGPHRWATTALATTALLASLWVIYNVVPPLVIDLDHRLLALTPNHWFAGILEMLGAVWESMTPTEKAALALIGTAAVLLSGGGLGLGLSVGAGIATALDAARGTAALTRDPWGTTNQYLATHNTLDITTDAALAAMTVIPGGKGLRGAARAGRTLTHEETTAARLVDWDDPRKVQKWLDALPTRTHPPTTPAYRYQHRVLGTNVERHLLSDTGDEIWADSVTIDGHGVTMAWDAKYTESGPKALYEGRAPDFIINKFDIEIQKYGSVINSPSNPISHLNLVTNTPEAAAYLGQRAREILGPNVTLTVHMIP